MTLQNNFTEFESLLLQKMNKRAMIIVQIESLLNCFKIPFNIESLYSLEDSNLNTVLEMAQNIENNKKKYVETNG